MRRSLLFRGSLGILPLLFACSSPSVASVDAVVDESPRETAAASAVPPHSASIATALGEPLPEAAPAHLALSLRRADEEGLTTLLQAQQDPSSPSYHAWLTPEQFGERFGVPAATYARITSWLEGAGFTVTTYPNRLFVEATGTSRQVRELLGVQLRTAEANGRGFHSHAGAPSVPAEFAPLVQKIGGLDTRLHLRHHLAVPWYGATVHVLGADDLRTLYDVPKTGGAAGLTLVVLGTQEGTQSTPSAKVSAPMVLPSRDAIQSYLADVAHATAPYTPIVLPNPGDDLDAVGSNAESQLDVEMQSVGAPDAAALDLVLAPASLVFQVGAQYIVNHLSSAVAVSTSLGDCEAREIGYPGGAITTPTSDAYLMRQAVQQGIAEGQTWFAASGDRGPDDCGLDATPAATDLAAGTTVDFPCSLPEVVCVGGTQAASLAWSATGALTAYGAEDVWNEAPSGGAGGGGQSGLYEKPAWQKGVGPMANDGRRDVPDLALIAASNTPGVVDYDCGPGQDGCPDAGTGHPGLDVTGGTSVASPLAAGLFASLAGHVGCRQGDVHQALYALGAAQAAGGAQVFHDVTTGNNDWIEPGGKHILGFPAAAGFDLATGWGSMDLGQLIAAWPACAPAESLPATADAGTGGAPAPQPRATTTSDAGVSTSPTTEPVRSGCSASGGATTGGAGSWLAVLGGLLVARRRRVVARRAK